MANRRDLTEREKIMAERLKRIWHAKKKELGYKSQEELAHEIGFKTQGAVSQYLNGKIPLSILALVQFSKALKFDPSEVDPAIRIDEKGDIRIDATSEHERFGISKSSVSASDDSLSPQARALISKIKKMDQLGEISPIQCEMLRQFLESLRAPASTKKTG